MKNILVLILLFNLNSCDKPESLDALIENDTSINLKICFVSSQVLQSLPENKESIDIQSMKSKYYDRIGINNDEGGVIGNYSLIEFDSIYITTTTNEVLKIFKSDTPGKNIYNIDQYWIIRETGKNHFEYTYTITDEDIEN